MLGGFNFEVMHQFEVKDNKKIKKKNLELSTRITVKLNIEHFDYSVFELNRSKNNSRK